MRRAASHDGPDAAPSPTRPVPRWAEALAHLMDEAIPIPGTERRIGVDALLGFLLPGLGDALGTGSAVILVVLGFTLRVPGVVLARMGINVAVDALIGAIPLVGDVFDVGWKANSRNLELIRRFQDPHRTASPLDYLVVGGVVVATVLVALAPILLLGWILGRGLSAR